MSGIMRHRHGGSSAVGFEIGRYIFKGLLNSTYRTRWRIGNDIERCTLCGRCQAICPVNAISLSVHNKTWTLNNRRCTQCLNCVVKCPVHCLSQVSL